MSMIQKYLFDHTFDVEQTKSEAPVQAVRKGTDNTSASSNQDVADQSKNKNIYPDDPLNDGEKTSVTQRRPYEEGFQDGFQKGRDFKSQESNEVAAKIVAKMSTTLDEFYRTLKAQHLEGVDLAIHMTRQVIEKTFPSLLEHKALAFADLRHNIAQVINATQKKSIKLTVNPDMEPFVEAHLKEIPDLFFEVLQDATLSKGDCRIVWDQTGVDIIKKRFLSEVETLLEHMGVCAQTRETKQGRA